MFKPFCAHRRSSVDILVACAKIDTTFIGDFFRETHLSEHFGQEGRNALIKCPKNRNLPTREELIKRDELSGTNGISAKVFDFLQFSAKICASQML